MLIYSIERPAAAAGKLKLWHQRKSIKLQPDEVAKRVDFRLQGYLWIVDGARGLLAKDGSWLKYDITYPIGGGPTIVLRDL